MPLADLNDLEDPLRGHETDRDLLTGNIRPQPSSNPIPQSYLTNSIPGEDRRASSNTLDESVWETLSRDLSAVWEKMRLVLWPSNLLGGILTRRDAGDAAEQGEADRLTGRIRGIAAQLTDADTVLQGGMSEGLRNWDLWSVVASMSTEKRLLTTQKGAPCYSASFSLCSCRSAHKRSKKPMSSPECLR